MESTTELNELAAALALAQAEIAGAHKNAANPYYKSKYSDLASCWSAAREPLTKHGLAVVQNPSAEGPVVSLETILIHKSGQWMSGTMTATAKDGSPQALVSIVTYLRRVGLCSVCSIAPVDDDAESAQSHKNKIKTPDGFNKWWAGMNKAADAGTDALRLAWEASPPSMRTFTTNSREEAWGELKAKAENA